MCLSMKWERHNIFTIVPAQTRILNLIDRAKVCNVPSYRYPRLVCNALGTITIEQDLASGVKARAMACNMRTHCVRQL
jgi:hypothetical protein